MSRALRVDPRSGSVHSLRSRIDPNEPHPDQVWTRDGDCTTTRGPPSQPLPFFVTTRIRLDGTCGRTLKIPTHPPSGGLNQPCRPWSHADNEGPRQIDTEYAFRVSVVLAKDLKDDRWATILTPVRQTKDPPRAHSPGESSACLSGVFPFSATTTGHFRWSWCLMADGFQRQIRARG